ncbi:unnamed protein product [Fusarium graminearum]|uniref:Chromosome 1, complete genome n=2 Tax=Gibberella zeae (strain ATCC MYA-4620 / CBS 123657 / FGSC 9075 / NRRL 31084 / PH-1) TaxID=229533 RepID=A0A1C3YHY7_GIBZE|nr:unnamed protein product [Fusarium graminearum]
MTNNPPDRPVGPTNTDLKSRDSFAVRQTSVFLPDHVQNMGANDDSNDDEIEKLRDILNCMDKSQIDARDADGDTALHNATRRGFKRVALKLFSVGADVSVVNDSGNQPLHIACFKGLFWFAKELVNRGADIEAGDKHSQSPLFIASWEGHADIVELLLQHNAETKVLNVNGVTPMSMAFNWVTNNNGWSPLHEAISDDRMDVVDLLLEAGARVDHRDDDGWTPLMSAVCRDNVAATRKLLEHDKTLGVRQLETRDALGYTPLAVAARRGFVAGVRLLIDAGADCNALDEGSQRSVLTDACRFRQAEIVKVLLDTGKITDGNILDAQNFTAMRIASSYGHTRIVELLLRYETILNISDQEKVEAMVEASWQGCESVVELLLGPKGNVAVDALNSHGMTALHHACWGKIENMQSLDDLQWIGSDGLTQDERRDPKYQCCRHASVVRLLLERGAKPDFKSTSGTPPLNFAAETGDPERIRLIIEGIRGEQVMEYALNGETVLGVAFGEKNPEAAMRAILSSSKLTVADFGSETKERDALIWAAGSSKTHDVAKLLLSKSRSITDTRAVPSESAGWGAIEWAVFLDRPDILWLLLASTPSSQQMDITLNRAMFLAAEGSRITQSQTADQDTEPSENKAESGTGENGSQDKLGNKQVLIDILHDPPFGLLQRDSETYNHPVFDLGLTDVLDQFKSTVMQLYQDQNESSLIRRYRTVREVIYETGPRNIMKQTIQDLRGIIGTSGSTPSMVNIEARPSFTWIHLPAANMTWMNDIVQRILKDDDYSTRDYRNITSFLQGSWGEIPDKTSPSRMMRPRAITTNTNLSGLAQNSTRTGRDRGYHKDEEDMKANMERENETDGAEHDTRNNDGNAAAKGPGQKDPKMDGGEERGGTAPSGRTKTVIPASAIYMPYLAFSTQHRDDIDLGPTESPNSDKAKLEQVKKASEIHKNHMQCYGGSVVHGSPTLDEWYYHFAEDPESTQERLYRNQSQVVNKNLQVDANQLAHWPLLRVNQLWIWTIDNKWLITASSEQVVDGKDELLKGILHHLRKQVETQGSHSQPSSVSAMGNFIVNYCIGSYERQRETENRDPKAESQLSIRQIYSNEINTIGRNETAVFDEFNDKARKRRNELHPRPENQVSAYNDIKETMKKAEMLYCDIKDIRDELSIIKSVAQYQRTVQDQIASNHGTVSNLTANYISNDVREMDNVAIRIQGAQSEVANFQATLSVEQGQQAAKQGRTLMVFTVVTILFLPLSFLSSLFAMDVESFQRSPSWALATIFSVSFAFFIPLATYAIYSNEISNLIRSRKHKDSEDVDEQLVRRGTGLSVRRTFNSATLQPAGSPRYSVSDASGKNHTGRESYQLRARNTYNGKNEDGSASIGSKRL